LNGGLDHSRARRDRQMLLVDAYNVLHTTGVLPPDLAGPEVEDLAQLIGRSRYGRHQAWLVCDGAGSERIGARAFQGRPSVLRLGHVRIVFAGAGKEADDEIERVLAGSSAARRMIVVSSDRRIRAAARRVRAVSLDSRTFLGHMVADNEVGKSVQPGRSSEPLDPGSVAAWMEEFGYAMPSHTAPKPATTSRPEPRTQVVPSARSLPHQPHRTHTTREITNAEIAPEPIDPLLLEALRHWMGRISLGELDMKQWLDGHSSTPKETAPRPARSGQRAHGRPGRRSG